MAKIFSLFGEIFIENDQAKRASKKRPTKPKSLKVEFQALSAMSERLVLLLLLG